MAPNSPAKKTNGSGVAPSNLDWRKPAAPTTGSAEAKQTFNPLQASDKIKRRYREFYETQFAKHNEGLRREMRAKLVDGKVWTDTFISLSHPYPREKKVTDFSGKGPQDLDPLVEHAIPFLNLYQHQSDAIDKILHGENVVIATGTGSGKTEGFTLPIISHCIRESKKGTPGVKAVLVYPMKALEADQLNRLRSALYYVNQHLEKPIRVGVFDGDTPGTIGGLIHESLSSRYNCPLRPADRAKSSKCDGCNGLKIAIQKTSDPNRYDFGCTERAEIKIPFEVQTRQEMRANPPDILITNYTNVEYMLLRQDDRSFWESGTVRYLVLDELHNYNGAQGIDVALLMRRLRTRLTAHGATKIQCIATSATLSKNKDGKSLHIEAADFAARMFGQPFKPENVVTSKPVQIEFPKAKGILSHDTADPVRLTKSLKEDTFFQQLHDHLREPRRVRELAQLLHQDATIRKAYPTLDDVKAAVWTYLNMGHEAVEIRDGQRENLLRINAHNFFKILDGLYRCLNCDKVYADESDQCGCGAHATFPIAVCRNCHNEYVFFQIEKPTRDPVIEKTPYRFSPRGIRTASKVLSRKPIEPEWLDGPENDPESLDVAALSATATNALCKDCGTFYNDQATGKCATNGCRDGSVIRVYDYFTAVKGRHKGLSNLSSCPSCGQSRRMQPIINLLNMSPENSANVLFEQVYLALPADKRKLLVFTDSIQRSSKFAYEIEEEHLVQTLKGEIINLIRDARKDGQVDARLKHILDRVENRVRAWFIEAPTGLVTKRIEDAKRWILREVANTIAGERNNIEDLGLVAYTYDGLETPNHLVDHAENDANFSGIVGEFGISPEQAWVLLRHVLSEVRSVGALTTAINERLQMGRAVGFTGVIANPSTGHPTEAYRVSVHNLCSSRFLQTHVMTHYTEEVAEAKRLIAACAKFLQRNSLRLLREEQVNSPWAGKPGKQLLLLDDSKIRLGFPGTVTYCGVCKTVQTNPMPAATKCSAAHCEGDVKTVPYEEWLDLNKHDYFFHTYQNSTPVKLVTEADTGMVNKEDRQRIEAGFRVDDPQKRLVDMVVATPTLELGIDIGDLLSVGLYRAPPSPASYTQRVGRAGRRDRLSLNTTFLWPAFVDNYYFQQPEQLIRGDINPPRVDVSNPVLLGRHLNALIVEYLFNHAHKTYPRNAVDWIDTGNPMAANFLGDLQHKRAQVEERLTSFLTTTGLDKLGIKPSDTVDAFLVKANKMFTAFRDQFRNSVKYFQEINKHVEAAKKDEKEDLQRKADLADKRLWQLKEIDILSTFKDWDLIPTYAFNHNTLTLTTAFEDFPTRDASVAVAEYFPGQKINLNKKKYRAVGVDMEGKPETAAFKFCGHCQGYGTDAVEGFQKCPVCGQPGTAIDRPALHPRRIVVKYEGFGSHRTANAFVAQSTFVTIPSTPPEESEFSSGIRVRNWGLGDVTTLVSGRQTPDGSVNRLTLCDKCGQSNFANPDADDDGDEDPNEPPPQHNHLNYPWVKCAGKYIPAELYDRLKTFIIELDFTEQKLQSGPLTEEQLITLKNALLNASTRQIEIAESEIDGLVVGQKIFLYDNVEGGTGYVRQVLQNIAQVFEAAHRLVNLHPDDACHEGCLKCIASYWRRMDYALLRKSQIAPLLANLCHRMVVKGITGLAVAATPTLEPPPQDPLREIVAGQEYHTASSPPGDLRHANLVRQLLYAAESDIRISTLYVHQAKVDWPDRSYESWLDILSRIKEKKPHLPIRVMIRAPDKPQRELEAALLVKAGIDLRVYKQADRRFGGINHAKDILVDTLLPSAGLVRTSMNLGPEAKNNNDSFNFFVKASVIQDAAKAFDKLWDEAMPYTPSATESPPIITEEHA